MSSLLNLSNDDFIRTTEQRHKKSVQSLWEILEKNDDIYLSKYSGWYSVRDEAFVADNEIEERGGKKFNSFGSELTWVEEESYFFRLSKWQDKLIKFYDDNPDFIVPKSRSNEVRKFVESGLKDLSVSRTTFNWGIKVPTNDKHIVYVWLDALTNYISALGFPDTANDNYKKYWPGIHVVGKDIIRFHAVFWPAFLMAAELEPPKQVVAHGWWTNEGQKISKSTGNVIDPHELIDSYGLDEVRYFLFREVPFGNDGDFSRDSIKNRINGELANNFGNLIQRVLSFIVKNLDQNIELTDNNFKFNTFVDILEMEKSQIINSMNT
jgi:methionyl-tRNA synthetase